MSKNTKIGLIVKYITTQSSFDFSIEAETWWLASIAYNIFEGICGEINKDIIQEFPNYTLKSNYPIPTKATIEKIEWGQSVGNYYFARAFVPYNKVQMKKVKDIFSKEIKPFLKKETFTQIIV